MKVTVHTPASQELTRDAKKEVIVTDAAGRAIKMRKPNVLAQFRLVKMLGDAARNASYMALVTPLTYIAEINGEPVILPNSERELDALIQLLDDEGVMAVMDGLQTHFGADGTRDSEQALKNS